MGRDSIELYNVGDFDPWDEGLDMRCYTADFETTTDLDDCRVWAFATCPIDGRYEVEYGNSIEGFMSWCECVANCRVYFHNLAFDGAFLISWLETHGWRWVENRQDVSDMTYTTLISDMNQVYSITLYFTPQWRVTIYDSLKVIPLSIEQMAKAYHLPILKGELDYTAYREPGHILTQEEKDYIRNDVQIAAMALKTVLDEGMQKMTAGSNALYTFKKSVGGAHGFRKLFPLLDSQQDAFIRKAYRGGFTYVSPRFAGKKLGEGIVFDVNSLYPSVMASCDGQLLPYGKPVWFDGEPPFGDSHHPLWVASVSCKFKVKPEHIPCIQLKGNWRFGSTEYVEDSKGEVTMCVTNVDWELINRQYDVRMVEWNGGYCFKGADWIFRKYVEHWNGVKVEAGREGNAGQRQLAKLMLNSLYGKFATRTTVVSRRPVMDDDGVLHYVDMEPEERDGVYLPVGVFVTSWARFKTITSAQAVYGRFVYADTDSLHLVGTEIPDGLDVDAFRLGAWKHESTFDQAKFLRAKCYVEHEVGADGLTVHVAGMPSRCHGQVDIDTFDFGMKYRGKLYQRRVKGGIVLVEGDMEIRR